MPTNARPKIVSWWWRHIAHAGVVASSVTPVCVLNTFHAHGYFSDLFQCLWSHWISADKRRQSAMREYHYVKVWSHFITSNIPPFLVQLTQVLILFHKIEIIHPGYKLWLLLVLLIRFNIMIHHHTQTFHTLIHSRLSILYLKYS